MRAMLAVVVSLGCTQEARKAPDAAVAAAEKPSPSPSPAEAPPDAAAEARLVGGGKMEHCPTGVEGADVKITDTAGAVEITVTSKDAKATAEIREDAKHVLAVSKKDAKAVRHTGEGEGGGGLGQCAVVLKNTEITVADVDGGSKITIKPKKADELEALKKDVRARYAKAPAAQAAPSVTGTVGGGRMQHCPTTIAGAKVDIVDDKDSVEVTVTSADAKVTSEIRADAKHLAAAAKKDPKDVKHTGEGEGGGGLGKCPIVLKDTQIAAADVPGGSKITLRPKDKAQLDWLKREVRTRQGAAAQ